MAKQKVTLKGIWGVLKASFTGFGDHKVTKLSGSLAYYTVFSMAPLLVVIISLCGIFLGREIAQNRDYSEQTAQLIDQEVREIVEHNFKRARGLITEKVEILHHLAKALLEHEVLDGEEIETIVSGKEFVKKPKPSGGTPPTQGGEEKSGEPVVTPPSSSKPVMV